MILALVALVEGHVDLADFLFLVGAILAGVACVTYIMAKNVSMALFTAAAALVALGWFVL